MKIILTYIITIIVVFVSANYVYVLSGCYKDDIKKCNGELIDTIDLAGEKHLTLYFAESSNFTSAEKDSSKESISEILNASLHNIKAINKAASHSGNYKNLIFRLKGSKIDTIIVTMNLRSFGINWIESKLETNLSRSNIIYSAYPPILKKLLIAFKFYDNKEIFQREKIIKRHYKKDILFDEPGKFKNVKEWDRFLFSKGHLKANGERDAEKCELSCHYVKNYAFLINENNPRIKDFDEIVEFCTKNRIKLILNLLPENTERAEALCGKDLTYLMRKNVDFLEKRYSRNTIFVNSLDLLSDSNFIDRSWPTEHYDYQGRKKVAEHLAARIKPAP